MKKTEPAPRCEYCEFGHQCCADATWAVALKTGTSRVGKSSVVMCAKHHERIHRGYDCPDCKPLPKENQ
jgi:hypothetical protein